MKKIKGLLFAFVALFAFTLAMVKVSAEVVFSYDADSDTQTSYAKNAAVSLVTGSDLATVNTVRSCSISATGAGTATFVDDATLTFTSGMVPEGNCGTAANAALKVVSKVAGVKIGYYYTISDSTFASSPTAVNAGSVIIMNAAGEVLRTFDDVAGKNDEAYYVEYTINSANETILIGSAKRVITFALVISQGEVAQEHTVTIMDGASQLRQQNVVDGETLSYVPVKYGFDFCGYYLDEGFETPFEGVVTEDVTVYVKWLPWDISIEPNHLTSGLVYKLAESFASFDAAQPLTGTIFTIMKGCQTEVSSVSIKTAGGLAPKTEEKGIKIDAPEAGTLTVRVVSGGSSARNARLAVLEGTAIVEIPSVSGDPVFLDNQTTESDIREISYHLDAAGTYYFGGSNGFKVFEMTFVGDSEPSTEFYVQTGYNAAGTELVRGIMICNNISADELAEGLARMEIAIYDGETKLLDVTSLVTIANRLMNNGQTYVAEINGQNYEFGIKDNTLYIVAVIAISNYEPTNLGEEFVGKTLSIKVSVTVDGYSQEVENKTFTVQGAAGRPQA